MTSSHEYDLSTHVTVVGGEKKVRYHNEDTLASWLAAQTKLDLAVPEMFK